MNKPIFGPKEKYELFGGIVDIIPGAIKLLRQDKQQKLKVLLRDVARKGFMPQVTFTSAAVVKDNVVRLFYGVGDQFICTAIASLDDILLLLKEGQSLKNYE